LGKKASIRLVCIAADLRHDVGSQSNNGYVEVKVVTNRRVARHPFPALDIHENQIERRLGLFEEVQALNAIACQADGYSQLLNSSISAFD
jgi:hypothetical protein